MNNDFYTLTTYIHNQNLITYPMEDYLEMIYRKQDEPLTITSLSNYLNFGITLKCSFFMLWVYLIWRTVC